MRSVGNPHLSEGRSDARDGVLILLGFSRHYLEHRKSGWFVQRSPQYVYVGVLHGVLLVSFCIPCQILIQQLARAH